MKVHIHISVQKTWMIFQFYEILENTGSCYSIFFTFSLLLIPLFNFRENSSSVFCPGRSLRKRMKNSRKRSKKEEYEEDGGQLLKKQDDKIKKEIEEVAEGGSDASETG